MPENMLSSRGILLHSRIRGDFGGGVIPNFCMEINVVFQGKLSSRWWDPEQACRGCPDTRKKDLRFGVSQMARK